MTSLNNVLMRIVAVFAASGLSVIGAGAIAGRARAGGHRCCRRCGAASREPGCARRLGGQGRLAQRRAGHAGRAGAWRRPPTAARRRSGGYVAAHAHRS